MSEKNLWQWLNGKMSGHCGWAGERIENCSTSGISDIFIAVSAAGSRISCFVELKDWSGKNIHPLTVEQKNFLEDFGGAVLIKTSAREICVCPPHHNLTIGDKRWARENGELVDIIHFKPEELAQSIVATYGTWLYSG